VGGFFLKKILLWLYRLAYRFRPCAGVAAAEEEKKTAADPSATLTSMHAFHMTQEPSVAIIILNWNGYNDTIECLQSLRQLTYRHYKIVLVDNGSANNEGGRIKESYPEIHLIENKANRGFAGGCNDGINWAIRSGFDYIITLNNDCLVEKAWLSNLVSGLNAAQADFGSSRIMYYPETDLICSDGDGILPDGTGYVVNPLKPFPAPGQHQPIFSACGAAAVFSKRCLEAVRIHGDQFFDELFFAYFEDVDLGARLHALAYTGVSIPDAVVYHKESKTAGSRSFFKIYQSEKNRLLVELLNFPFWLIVLGELYYTTRTASRNIVKFFPVKRKNKTRPMPLKNFSPWGVLLKSRWWIVINFSKIWADRRERKSKGLISGSICRWLCWDILRLLSFRQ
jgi:GT2 family glycosyltransferase